MNYRPFIFALEALLLGGPITFIAFFLFFIIISPFTGTTFDGEVIWLPAVGTWLALSEYWRLAYATIIGKRHKFGLLFWTAISGAVGAIYLFYELRLFKSPTMLLLLVGIIFATGHFIFLQLKYGKTLCPGSGAASQ